MKETARLIYRDLGTNPELCARLEAVENAVEDFHTVQFQKFISTLTDLRAVSRKRLSTSVEEDKAREDLLQEVIGRERKASQEKKALEQELTSVKRERQTSQGNRDDQILKLIEEISTISTTSGENETVLELKAHADMQALEEAFHTDKGTAEKKIEQLRTKLRDMQSRHDTAPAKDNGEHDLRKKKIALQGAVEELVIKYDTAMLDLDTQYSKLKAQYDEEK